MLKKINKIKEKTVLWIRIILIMTPEENSNFTSIENMIIYMNNKQGWGAGAGRSRVFLAPWSRSRLEKKVRSRSR